MSKLTVLGLAAIVSICMLLGMSGYPSQQTASSGLQLLSSYDWTQDLNVNYQTDMADGNQILHINPHNKPYTRTALAKKFVEEYLTQAEHLESDAAVLKKASDSVALNGYYLEMGVGPGRTINFIAALNPSKTIYGFDSYEGLPEDWYKGDKVIPKGTFAAKNVKYKPFVYNNVKIYKGFFKDTLPKFKQLMGNTPIAFLHIDCVLYSSTKDVFAALGANIVPGTIILFDELYNYPLYAGGEWKALQEFVKNRFRLEFLAFNINHEQVAVRIKAL